MGSLTRIRIEFPAARSPHFQRVLGLCQRFGLKKFNDGDQELYSVEFKEDQLYSFEAIYHMIHGWKGAVFFVDDVMMTRSRVFQHTQTKLAQMDYARRKVANLLFRLRQKGKEGDTNR